jgi:hypothetical protein
MAVATTNMLGPAAGCIHINGTDYKPTNGVYVIPTALVSLAEQSGLEIVNAKSAAGAPTVANIPAGVSEVWKNTGDGTVKLYYNDGGTLKSVTLS